MLGALLFLQAQIWSMGIDRLKNPLTKFEITLIFLSIVISKSNFNLSIYLKREVDESNPHISVIYSPNFEDGWWVNLNNKPLELK